MKHTFLKLFFLLSLLTSSTILLATHNRAGQIAVEQVGDCGNSQNLRVRITVTTYTRASSVQADRDTVTVCFGDGVCENVARANGPGSPPQGELLENDTKVNFYIVEHTYPSRGSFTVSMTDPNRNADILNVNPPNSQEIRFHIETVYTFPSPQNQGCNNTPILLQPPVDIGCVGQVFTHNPNAYDPEGDSLSYHFTVPLASEDLEVPNYFFPDQLGAGPDNILTIDEVTGDIVWDAPQQAGEYNLAMIIVEYRNGSPIDTILRDMQILIENCDNMPPEVITSVDEICVIAGDTVNIEVTATAPLVETDQLVRLTALGGPFEVDISPATFTPNDNSFQEDPVVKTFTWITDCDHISDQYYSVVFKATDNFFGDSTGLATLKTVRIKVVGPPPEDVQTAELDNAVEISWELPYSCEDAPDNYFLGFTVWRRESSNNFPLDTCVTGLDGRGYTRLFNAPINEIAGDRYAYVDEAVEPGRNYCYRVLGVFARTVPGGNNYTYNQVESLPSREACVSLAREIPLMTKVSVTDTDAATGSIEVCWTKPLAEDLDTIQNMGPYTYEVIREVGQTTNPDGLSPIGQTFTSLTFAGANDTCFVDNNLNTTDNAYSYAVNFFIEDDELLGTSNAASSIYLSIAPTDEANVLSWTEAVPWNNFEYDVYRQNTDGTFGLIATVSAPTYRDEGLTNGEEYCYYVISRGSYGIEGIIEPLVNQSQENCSIPFDNVPPRAPILQVTNLCDEMTNCDDLTELINSLIWNNPNDDCDDTDDVEAYNIYYAPTEGQDLQVIARNDGAGNTTFDHEPDLGLAGCYAVTALDENENESVPSNIVCVDNCPSYVLPNTFTPNTDGQNDFFRPMVSCFVAEVEFKVFNRWGQLVFETSEAELNWNGTNLSNKDLPQGTYYYTCRVFEQRVTGIQQQEEILSGYIELLRPN